MTVAAGATVDATDITTLQAYTTGRPLVRLVAQSTQSMADNVASAISFGAGSEDIDTHGYHDTATSPTRVTPTLAGYYRVNGWFYLAAQTTGVSISAYLRKNGATNLPSGGRTSGQSAASGTGVDAIVAFNGTTDYIELMGLQDSSGAVNSNASVQFSSVLELEFLRPL